MRVGFNFCGKRWACVALLAACVGCVRSPYFQADARPDAQHTTPLPPTADSVRGATAGRQYNRHGALYNALVGWHHRRSWAAPVTVPVFRLPTAVPGGLRPGKLGGGFNSTSLSLSTPGGQSYVLRTVDKDPSKAMPRLLRGTFLVNALRDNVSSTQPFAALVVPPLAAAANVPHTQPRLFYVTPTDPAFAGDSLRNFRGQLALLEQKFTGAAALVPGLGPVAVHSSAEAFAAVFANPGARVDQSAMLRARLLDAWLGDWDRHPGQWNWAVRPGSEAMAPTYLPLPKDRDMVFYRLDDGALGWVVGHVLLRHWRTFGFKYSRLTNLLWSGRYVDARALNELSSQQFAGAARAIRAALPDTLLTRALLRMPPAAHAIEGARTLAELRARRDALPAMADKFYQLLAKRPVVGGTAGAERFEVRRYADSTVVRVTHNAGKLLFRRAYLPTETRTIRLEGLGGADVFNVTSVPGAARPRLRIFGGEGADVLQQPTGRGLRFRQGSAPAKKAYDVLPEE